jgi:hypothetical protein
MCVQVAPAADLPRPEHTWIQAVQSSCRSDCFGGIQSKITIVARSKTGGTALVCCDAGTLLLQLAGGMQCQARVPRKDVLKVVTHTCRQGGM